LFYNKGVDAIERFKLLCGQMEHEPGGDGGSSSLVDDCRNVIIYRAHLPNGKHMRLLKTLLSSVCEKDCAYCPFRSGRDFRRVSLQPDEFARMVTSLHRAGLIDGVFVSSGVAGGGVRTQDRLLACAELLRGRFDFQGYLHLKFMPGAEFAQVERGMQLADRVSLNLEAPNPERLRRFTRNKDFWKELWQPLEWVERIRREKTARLGWKGRWPSSSTQFVMGGAGESDQELLQVSQVLFTQLNLQRAYYSPFTPHRDTPLENQAPASRKREQRLYQASFLIRDYHYAWNELHFDPDGNLPVGLDPKAAWAEQHLSPQPVEINRASREQLLRIPGIGPKAAARILQARRERPIRDISQLTKMGIHVGMGGQYMLLNGRRPLLQPALW
jgi:predicted DNA-binding helix-hairpin-helix protein